MGQKETFVQKIMSQVCAQKKLPVRPAKTQISLDVHPVWSVFAVHMKKCWVLATHKAHSENWSDWVDAQADLSLHWCTGHFVGFVMQWLINLFMSYANNKGAELRRWVFLYSGVRRN